MLGCWTGRCLVEVDKAVVNKAERTDLDGEVGVKAGA